MIEKITDLGEIGTVNGIIRPLDLTIERDGGTWDLTNYGSPQLRVWDARTKTPITPGGSVAIQDAATGLLRYSPAADDPIYASSGVKEARLMVSPAGGGDPEPSGLFRFTIAAGP